ncbi:MAG: SLATT domain-containing protein [Gammaproteobacteria bacterium]|nr:SLATT domain-containing protein [Gammaproteobacteria bacterium]
MAKMKTEDPERIKVFLEKTTSLDWSSPKEALSTLKSEAFELLNHEVAYYYRIRQNKKSISGYLRFGMLLFGTLGILAPLAEAAKLYEVGNYGYLLLAISGAFLTANNLFGGTTGHARFITTQLQLEKIIAVSTVKWNELEHKLDQDADKTSEIELEMFQFIISTLDEAYLLIIDETNEWNESLNAALADFEKRYKKSKNGK